MLLQVKKEKKKKKEARDWIDQRQREAGDS